MRELLPPGAIEGADLRQLNTLLIENAADSIFALDAEGRTIYANKAAVRTFGWTLEELRHKFLHDVLHHHHPDGRPFPMSECPLGNVFKSKKTLEKHEDVFFHRNGSKVYVTCSNAPIQKDGEMLGAVLLAVDITERKRVEEQQQLLLQELNHRAKNTLATVQAIVKQSIRHSTSLEQAAASIQDRLLALSDIHSLLMTSRWEGADLGEIVRTLRKAFVGREDRLKDHGPFVKLDAQTALNMSLLLNELATNATKYGSMSTLDGELHISWTLAEGVDRQTTLKLEWRETGGPPVTQPSTKGFGTKLIERSFPQRSGARLNMDYRSDGLLFMLELPLPSSED